VIELRAKPLVLRLRRQVRIARGSMSTTELVQVRVRYGGVTGYGEGAPTGWFGETLPDAVRFLQAEATREAIGDDPWAIEEIESRLNAMPGNYAAKAAIDCALHDLQGRLAGVPVWRLLGLRRSDTATSQTISIGGPDQMAADAREVSSSVRRLKLKLGGRDGLDIERVAAVRSATDRALQVDVNGRWTFDEAVGSLPALASHGVELCEQPLSLAAEEGADLKRLSPIPIYLDEDCRRSSDVPACAARGHGVVLKLSKCGGLREGLRAIATARALGLGVMLGCMAESSLGIAAANQLAGAADYLDLDGNLDLAWDPWRGVPFSDGVQRQTTEPGLGVQAVPAAAGRRLRTVADTTYRAQIRPGVRRAYLSARQRRLKQAY
jgi:L-alanine-DL-glutamate epimerase-like enolase superfamily enzyme